MVKGNPTAQHQGSTLDPEAVDRGRSDPIRTVTTLWEKLIDETGMAETIE